MKGLVNHRRLYAVNRLILFVSTVFWTWKKESRRYAGFPDESDELSLTTLEHCLGGRTKLYAERAGVSLRRVDGNI